MATTPITGPLDCSEAQETTILASRIYNQGKKCNPYQTEGLWPMEMHRFLNSKKDHYDQQKSQLQAISLLTFSAIPGTHPTYWQSVDFKSSCNSTNCAMKTAQTLFLAKPNRQILNCSTKGSTQVQLRIFGILEYQLLPGKGYCWGNVQQKQSHLKCFCAFSERECSSCR